MAGDISNSNNLEKALYIVATPIGNLKDITLRAIKILKQVDVIASEDTRNTSVLLAKYEINTKLISYEKFSENKKADLFLNYLREGKSIALVTDAGTPLISDPGEILVEKVRQNNFKVIPIPGACAIITFLSSIPRYREDFKFIGFIPRNKNQIIELVTKNITENLIFYESPSRLIETLTTISEVFPDKMIATGRELTKKFEEIRTDNILNVIEYYKNNTLKGEFVIMLYSSKDSKELDIAEKIRKLKKLNLKDKEIAKIISVLYDTNKNKVYKNCLDINT